jgi:hypothetical protein
MSAQENKTLVRREQQEHSGTIPLTSTQHRNSSLPIRPRLPRAPGITFPKRLPGCGKHH